MAKDILRIAITGPESTGKSMLASQLADYYQTTFVDEYARTYINDLKRPYQEHDILQIAQGQLVQEQAMSRKANQLLFCDTELTVCKIWSEVKYKRCHQWIDDQLINHIYPLYLLMDIDLEWHDDPQREHPHLREYLFDLYRSNLLARRVNFKIVSGIDKNRLLCAVNHIEEFLADNRPFQIPNTPQLTDKL